MPVQRKAKVRHLHAPDRCSSQQSSARPARGPVVQRTTRHDAFSTGSRLNHGPRTSPRPRAREDNSAHCEVPWQGLGAGCHAAAEAGMGLVGHAPGAAAIAPDSLRDMLTLCAHGASSSVVSSSSTGHLRVAGWARVATIGAQREAPRRPRWRLEHAKATVDGTEPAILPHGKGQHQASALAKACRPMWHSNQAQPKVGVASSAMEQMCAGTGQGPPTVGDGAGPWFYRRKWVLCALRDARRATGWRGARATPFQRMHHPRELPARASATSRHTAAIDISSSLTT